MPCSPRTQGHLLALSPNSCLAVLAQLDVNDVRMAADRTIFNVFLFRSRRQVDGHHNLLTAGIAEVAGLVLHGFSGGLVSAAAVRRNSGAPPKSNSVVSTIAPTRVPSASSAAMRGSHARACVRITSPPRASARSRAASRTVASK